MQVQLDLEWSLARAAAAAAGAATSEASRSGRVNKSTNKGLAVAQPYSFSAGGLVRLRAILAAGTSTAASAQQRC